MKNQRRLFPLLLLFILSSCSLPDYPINRHAQSETNLEILTMPQGWVFEKNGMHAAVGSIYKRYPKYKRPTIHKKTWQGTAWSGERINIQIPVWSKENIQQIRCEFSVLHNQENQIEPHNFSYYKVHSTLAWKEMYHKPGHKGSTALDLVPDMLKRQNSFDLAAKTCRPIWITLDIPQQTVPGTYHGRLTIQAKDQQSIPIQLELTVLPHTLPRANEWTIHLDLWQNPFAVAEFHHVELWSEAHFALMRELYTRLADAGQKCITTSIIHHPWRAHTYSPFQSMIQWKKKQNGEWQYDFSIFDRYVDFVMSCGITQQINCYSMIPWGNTFQYFDENTNAYQSIITEPGQDSYRAHWRPFLKAFTKHLRAKNWLHKTYIAMDERDEQTMQSLMTILQEIAPELKIALAVNYATNKNPRVEDLSVAIQFSPEQSIISARNTAKRFTTFYVCTGPMRPNTFTKSPPHEAVWLGWFAAAHHYSGILRWAYNWWPENPILDSRYAKWPSGDTYLVYPGNYSSIRFECLRDGIEDYEKLKILNKELLATKKGRRQWQKMQKQLAHFNYENAQHPKKSLQILKKARETLHSTSQ